MQTHQASRPRIRWTSSVLCALPLLAGCFAYDTTVRLSLDGSGTVEQELVLTGGMAEMIRYARTAEEGEVDLCAEQDLGVGVRLVSAVPVEEAERVGCRQVYAFTDVNTLRLKPDVDKMLPEGSGRGEEARAASEDPITFRFRAGSPATLVVRMPEQETGDAEPEVREDAAEREGAAVGNEGEDAAGRAMALAMMREMLRGSRFSVHLVLQGQVVETDATYRDGDRITLVELDFDTLLEDTESLERLLDVQDPSPEEAKALLARTPGMKVETRKEVTVRFQ